MEFLDTRLHIDIQMKYSKWLFVLYTGCMLKIVATALYFLGIFSDFYFLTIVSIPIFLAMMFCEELIIFCFWGLILSLLSWVVSIFFSIMGIKFSKMRKWSLFAITFTVAIDLMATFISQSIEVRITCGIVSTTMLIVCLKAALNQKAVKNTTT